MSGGALDDVRLELVDSIDQAWEFKRWLGERHGSVKAIGVDTETASLNAYGGKPLRLVQIGDARRGWAIPWHLWGGVALEALKEWEGEYVFHNSRFDINWLRRASGFRIDWSRVHDTLTLGHIDDPTRTRALKTLSGMLIDPRAASSQVVLDKEMNLNNWDWETVPIVREGAGSSYWIYAALDPVLTMRLFERFEETRRRFSEPYELEMGTVRCIADMEWRGSRVDLEYSRRMTATIAAYSQQVREWIRENYGIENATSLQQCIACFESLGRTITSFTKSGHKSLDKAQLQTFLIERDENGNELPGNPLAQALLSLRRGEKFVGPYFKNFDALADADGFVHPTIWPVGTRTARMSITDPALQTLPRKDPTVRDAFIPRDGNVIITIDADQIEMRLAAHFSRDEGLRRAFVEEDDFFNTVASQAWGDTIVKGDPRRQTMKNGCVPLDTEILTQRGWLRHDQVVIGDYTIGYDWDRRTACWTRIEEVVHKEDEPLVRMSNQHWAVVTTPEHRWIANVEKTPRIEWTTTETARGSHRIGLAVSFDTAGSLPISDDEARLLGWALSDGSFDVQPFTGGPAQGREGWRRGVKITVSQSTKKHALEVFDLMERIPHHHMPSRRDPHYHAWQVRFSYARDLAKRIGFYTDDGRRPDPAAFALRFSTAQRQLTLDAMRKADGDYLFHKSDPWVIEFYRTLTYLDGQPSETHVVEPDGRGWQRSTHWTVRRRRSVFTGQRRLREPAGRAAVWCVNTEHGSWTMKQDNRIMLTGNCYGKLYGAGVPKIAMTAGVPIHTMETVMARFDESYPGIRKLQRAIERVARERDMSEGRPYVVTPTGRRLYGDSGKDYALTNYLIQSHAAEILKKGICDLDAVGLGEYLILPVHDELVLDVPREDVDDVKQTLEDTLNAVGKDYFVPLTWSADVMEDRWGSKYR